MFQIYVNKKNNLNCYSLFRSVYDNVYVLRKFIENKRRSYSLAESTKLVDLLGYAKLF